MRFEHRKTWKSETGILKFDKLFDVQFNLTSSGFNLTSPGFNLTPPGSISPHLGSISPHLGSISPHLGSISPHLGSISPHLGSISPHLGSISPHLWSFSPHLDSISPRLGSISSHVNQRVTKVKFFTSWYLLIVLEPWLYCVFQRRVTFRCRVRSATVREASGWSRAANRASLPVPPNSKPSNNGRSTLTSAPNRCCPNASGKVRQLYSFVYT